MTDARPIAVVSGSTGSIGAAAVARLSAEGYTVVALGRDETALAKLVEDHAAVTTVRVDLSDSAGLAGRLTHLDRVDALIHCAGIADVADAESGDVEHWRRIFEVNLVSAAELTRTLLPSLRSVRGHVVFVNAAYGMTGVPRWAAYVGSKAALRELADSLRAEEAPHGLRVTSIYPSGVRGPLLRRVRRSFGREYDPAQCLSPDSLAAVVLGVLRGPPDAQITDLAVKATPRPDDD